MPDPEEQKAEDPFSAVDFQLDFDLGDFDLKHTLVPYLYDQLDYNDVTQIAFGNYHGKIIMLKTAKGNTLTIHGSANLRSSNSIEQIMVEVNNDELYDFNAKIINDICDRFGTINHDVVRVPGKAELWQVVAPEA